MKNRYIQTVLNHVRDIGIVLYHKHIVHVRNGLGSYVTDSAGTDYYDLHGTEDRDIRNVKSVIIP